MATIYALNLEVFIFKGGTLSVLQGSEKLPTGGVIRVNLGEPPAKGYTGPTPTQFKYEVINFNLYTMEEKPMSPNTEEVD